MDTRSRALILLKENNLDTLIIENNPEHAEEICLAIEILAKKDILKEENLTFLQPSGKSTRFFPYTIARSLIFLHQANIHDEHIRKLAAQGNEGYTLAKGLKNLKNKNIAITHDVISLFEANMCDELLPHIANILILASDSQVISETITALKAKKGWSGYDLKRIDEGLKLLQANDQLDKSSVKTLIEFYGNPSLTKSMVNFAHDLIIARKEGVVSNETKPEAIPSYSLEKIMSMGIAQFKPKSSAEPGNVKQLEDAFRKTM